MCPPYYIHRCGLYIKFLHSRKWDHHSCLRNIIYSLKTNKYESLWDSSIRNEYEIFSLIFLLCICRMSINNQHYALHSITSLFNMQDYTCFSIRVPSSGSFLDPCEILENQNKYVVTQVWYRSHRFDIGHTGHITLTLYDRPHSCSAFQVTRKDLESSLKMAHGCRNM
jgi:hypothetical protein